MKKATRLLLSQIGTDTCKPVKVASIVYSKSKANDCYNNAMRLIDENGERYVLASGWLVGDFISQQGTAVIPHFWVIDTTTSVHLDPTPLLANDNFEYVYDLKVAEAGLTYKHIVPLPLLINQNGIFKIRLNADQYIDFDKFDIDYLFRTSSDH